MADVLIGIPPMLTHGTTMTSSDIVTFWVIISVIVAVVLVATITLAVAGNRSVQRQSQMKEAEQHYEAFPQPQGGEQPQVHTPEEEKILLLR
jgi:DNA-binding NarL/FixJ family response regulator